MKFIVTADQVPDGGWVAACPTVPGCESTGATKEQALANLEMLIRQMVPERLGGERPLELEIQEKDASE